MSAFFPARALGFVFVFAAALPAFAADSKLSFERDIRPILKAQCFDCHGEGEELKGGLDLRLRRFIAKGGESGPALKPGDLVASLIHEKVATGEMPPEEKHLNPAEIDLIAQWIEQGAPTLRPEPEEIGSGFVITDEERGWWAFQPVAPPAIPEVKNADRIRTPIDAFLLRKLEANGTAFSPDVDKATLLRRVTFDLTGLPPTPEELADFLADQDPGAFERVVDRLLESERFGERWARHWLDVAGYADSEGYTEKDAERNHAWRYRDYVVAAFNDDMPFDRFIREQLAGDEMVRQPYKEMPLEDQTRLAATGFLRMAPDGTGAGANNNEARNQVIADTIQIVGTSLLGMTMHCAQCHHHRYDPISTQDYYSLRAVFEPAFDWKNWKTPAGRQITLYTDADRAVAARIEEEAKKMDAGRLTLQEKYIAETFEKQLAKLDEGVREPIRQARQTPEKERSEEQKNLLKKYPSTNVTAGSLYLYERKKSDELKKMAEDAKKHRATKPEEGFIRALWESSGKESPPTFVFHRGDLEQPKESVGPRGLSVLGDRGASTIDENVDAVPTSGRRLRYAERLTSGIHPLVGRVLVNRFWSHLFGHGIVRSLGDFGVLGEKPTHPELLDWLAADFVANGWKLKRFVRQLVLSSAYRQSSARNPVLAESDPDNRLMGRMPVRRLDAESVRDAVLAASGKLNHALFGKPVPVMEDGVGQIVIGQENKDGEGKPGKAIDLGGNEYRRSLYVQARRSRPLETLKTFDRPEMAPNCTARSESTVAPQSLLLMNSQFVVDFSRHMAERIVAECGDDGKAQVDRAWRLTFSRAPSETEIEDSLYFIEAQTKSIVAPPKITGQPDPPAVETLALANFCQALFSANEFLYID